MTNYQKGAAYENKIKKMYEKMGAFMVRSAGSKSEVDLIGIDRFGTVLLVQCKCGYVSEPEKQRILKQLYSIKGRFPHTRIVGVLYIKDKKPVYAY